MKSVTASELGTPTKGKIEPVSLHVDRVLERKSGNGAAEVGEDAPDLAVTLTQ